MPIIDSNMRDDFRKRSKSASAKPDVRLVVTGGPRVGKSAISVRFLTRRFIGEYQRNVERVYRRNIQFGNDVIEYDLRDAGGVRDTSSIINWATCIAVIYSITDRGSFTLASTQLDELNTVLHLQNNKYQALSPCIALIGNKSDLDHIREVPHGEGKDLARKHGAGFWEVSASDDYHSTYKPLNSLIVESYLNFVTAKNTDSNSTAPLETNNNKPRAKSENLGTTSNRSSIDSELGDFELKKEFFKKQEDTISMSKDVKKRKKLTSEVRKQLDLKLNENKPPRRRKISAGKFSLDHYPVKDNTETVIIDNNNNTETANTRNENLFIDEQPRSNSWSRKDKKRASLRKSTDSKSNVTVIKSKSYSDLKSYAIEQNEQKVMLTPQLSRVQKLATEFDKHGGYKERSNEEVDATAAALLSPGVIAKSASFTKLTSLSMVDINKQTSAPMQVQVPSPKTTPKIAPKPTPKLKRERRKYFADSGSPVDENANISNPEKKSPENEKIPMKLKRNEQKKSIRRKISSIFRPNVPLES